MGSMMERIERSIKKHGTGKTFKLVLWEAANVLNPSAAWNRWRVRRNCTKFGKNVKLRGRVDIRVFNKGKVIIGDNVDIDGQLELWVRDNARIVIGDNCHIEKFVRLNTGLNGCIELGKNTYVGKFSIINSFDHVTVGPYGLISGNVMIIDAGHDTKMGKLMNEQDTQTAPIEIGKNVWLAWGSTVLKGTKIGDGAVIGAGSVVTKDIKPYAIAVGAPARVIKKRK
ncbi:MAG: DapH/DapD/GlmU-related protein [Candidatus Hadarchaeaceae archaeon]